MKIKLRLPRPPKDGRLSLTLIVVALNLILVGLVAFWFFGKPADLPASPPPPVPSATAVDINTVAPLALPQLELEVTPLPTLPPGTPLQESLSHSGLLVLSLADGYYNHLFAFHPQYLPLTRLTNDPYDDISPAVSPDGSRIAFSSRRNGYWNLYLLHLANGSVQPLTDSYAYEGSPSWSPDGKWLAYETYLNNNLEIMILSVDDLDSPPIRLTDHPAADYAPAWSPRGRQIAFISQRSGEPEVWLIDLDESLGRFTNISANSSHQENHPEWSPDGRYLVWGAAADGGHDLYLWDSGQPENPPRNLGPGFWPVWSPIGDTLAAGILSPNDTALSGYNLRQRTLAFPVEKLPGSLHGLDWAGGQFAEAFLSMPLPANAIEPAPILWSPVLEANPMPAAGRFGLVPLKDITAPNPYLVDLVDESFDELRKFTAIQSGWDFLSSLENAYLPLSEPPTLAAQQNWLFTGRAFAFNPVPLNAGWVMLVKEQINGQTYWRVFLKARYQDGSQGLPMTSPVWNINARYNDDPATYEQGGQPGPVPIGYWVDFTDLAARYNWERLPAQINWRTFVTAARFNQFVLTAGHDWASAMNDIFPPEALLTPTSIPPLTPMPTPTPDDPRWSLNTATPTAAPSPTPQPRPTWTARP